MESKQTAVQWLAEQVEQHILTFGSIDIRVFSVRSKHAIEMEKEQITDAYTMGSYDMAEKEFKPEQYYTETYGKQ